MEQKLSKFKPKIFSIYIFIYDTGVLVPPYFQNGAFQNPYHEKLRRYTPCLAMSERV